MNQKLDMNILVTMIVVMLPSRASATDVSRDDITPQFTEHGRKMLDIVIELQAEKKPCDVTIIVRDRSFRAHKNVLSAASPYFKAMLTNEKMRESIEQSNVHTVTLHDLDSEAFELIKNYIYTGRISITDSNVAALLAVASYLQMTDIEADCCDHMRNELNATNCLGIKLIADKYSCSRLLNYASDFALDAFEEVVQYPEFLELTEGELIDIVSDDSLNASEHTIYEAVMRWIRYQNDSGGDRTVHLPTLMQYVRLTLMEPNYLARVSNDPLIKACKQCLKYVDEATTHLSSHRFRGELSDGEPSLETHFKPRRHYHLFVVGGLINGQCTSSAERYDPREDKWTEMAPMKSPRGYVGAATLNNILYAVGGYHDSSTLSTIECYDLHSDKWTYNVKPLQLARTTVNEVATLKGVLYVIGGYDHNRSHSNSVVKYDPHTNKWIECKPFTQERSGHAVGVLNGYIYVLGGVVNEHVSNTVERYDPTRNEWHNESPMITKKSYFGSVAHKEYLYVVGGQGEYDVPLNSAERYDSRAQKWMFVSAMNEHRIDLGVAVANGLIYAVGGINSNEKPLNTVEVYDPQKEVWFKCAPMLKERTFFGLVAMKS